MRYVSSVALLALFAVSTVSAHHSYAIFDNTRTVALNGTVKKMEWVNPHAWLHIVVKDDSGAQVEWQLEARSPGELTRQSLRSIDFKPGDAISVEIWPARDGSKVGSVVRGKTAEGKPFGITAAAARGGGSPFANPAEGKPTGVAP